MITSADVSPHILYDSAQMSQQIPQTLGLLQEKFIFLQLWRVGVQNQGFDQFCLQ